MKDAVESRGRLRGVKENVNIFVLKKNKDIQSKKRLLKKKNLII